MNKKLLISLVVLAVIGVGGTTAFVLTQNKAVAPSATSDSSPSLVQRDSDTYKQYSMMSGVMYDRNFIANMIAHHEGAVEMAKLALDQAKHEEIKTMANDIITAQTKEIDMMKQWQSDWGYPSTSGDNMMDHSAMGMMDGMTMMEDSLKGKTGDEFDKAFLEQMIVHHQGAINMAAPGATRAQHQEVKDLTKRIIDAQSKEIRQMKQWQSDWGY